MLLLFYTHESLISPQFLTPGKICVYHLWTALYVLRMGQLIITLFWDLNNFSSITVCYLVVQSCPILIGIACEFFSRL